jgi:hypothetical protein
MAANFSGKIFPLILLLVLVFNNSLAAQCVMCRTAAEAESKTLGLNSGILYLMAVPYLVLGSGLLIWYLRKRQRAKE